MFRVTSYSDIAGQVSASSVNADRVTVGTVYLPTGGLNFIRRKLAPSFPKWRDATDENVRFVVDLLRREALSLGAGSVDKATADWCKFWEDARTTHNAAASLEGGSIGYLKAATLIKFLLFGQGCAAALGHAIFTGTVRRTSSRNRSLEVEESVVLDNEIQGDDNCEALVEIWKSINEYQPRSNVLGVRRTAKPPSLTSEQAEPLLLLADYVAGLVHAARSRADVLGRSDVSPAEAARSLEVLQRSGKLTDFSDTVRLDYFAIYPDFKNLSRRGVA